MWIQFFIALLTGRLHLTLEVRDRQAASSNVTALNIGPPETFALPETDEPIVSESSLKPPNLRSFYGESAAAAMREALAELGPDALVVSTRRTSGAQQYRGAFEVLCDAAQLKETESSESVLPGSFASELAKLGTVVRCSQVTQKEIDGARGKLEQQGIPSLMADNIVNPAAARCTRVDQLWPAVRTEIQQRIRTDSALLRESGGTKALAVVGPPGSGKTAVVDMLVARSIEIGACSVHVIMLMRDAGPIFVSEATGNQRTSVVGNTKLQAALDAYPDTEIVFIDAPGHREAEEMEELSRLLESRPDIDVHLALPLTLPDAEISRYVDLFEILRPNKLLFTKTDHRKAPGLILREAVRTGKPLSFLAQMDCGVPSLQPASSAWIANNIVTACNSDSSSSCSTRTTANVLVSR